MSQTYSQIKMVVGGEEINIPEVLTQDVSVVHPDYTSLTVIVQL